MFVNFSFSQEIELTIHKIDSIAKTSKNKIQSSGVIKKTKKQLEVSIVQRFFLMIN